jgi:hypothetical protein
MFQEKGHALQDFAKLETEIKFVIMDCQEGSATNKLPAYDYTYSQMPLWKEMEDQLLKNNWKSPKRRWSKDGYRENVVFCLDLVQTIREKAEQVQKQPLLHIPKLDFFDEYRPPLLFHTLRAIGYESISIFKRLLAVYSASSLLKGIGMR